ncbi:MAG: alpha-amylase [Hyphomicrobiales bacterium]|mgnify:CR=1 FL=1|nr:MAG: alpha-amylase [Hyphomicrobiales bacterium]
MSQSVLFQKTLALARAIYPDRDGEALARHFIGAFFGEEARPRKRGRVNGNSLWSERDALVITYGNSIVDGMHKPLDLLRDFLVNHLEGVLTGVHILPFFPYTSDDGFSVTDYTVVDSQLGSWEDIRRISQDFKVMSDLVLNHVSSQSTWFNAYRQGQPPYDRYFFEASPDDDVSEVVRPRAHPLLREVETANGPRHVWCTFSHDQVDLDFSNPEVLAEFLRIMRLHIANGVRIVRLDAVAFIWKEIGTPCIHHPNTHRIIQLIRVLCDFAEERVVLLTETNVPKRENLSYFGNRNEAHAIYNFSLPPLMLQALLTGSARHLRFWLMSMPPAQLGCTYLNFIASHDGIGVRGAEGILSEEELAELVDTVRTFGGRVSMRAMPGGGEKPYELNISLYDALAGTVAGPDQFQYERFLASQTAMMSLEGIPAFYIHSLLATPNDQEGVEKSGHNRAINRHRWDYDALAERLADPESRQHKVLREMKRRIRLRTREPAFHPNATQFTLQLDDALFGVWRQSLDRSQSLFAITNVSDKTVEMPALQLNLIDGDSWRDLLDGSCFDDPQGTITFAPYQSRWISNRD